MIKLMAFLILSSCFASSLYAAEGDVVNGIISQVDHSTKMVTLHNEQGYNHTYFVGGGTRFRSADKAIRLADLRPGQQATLRLGETDLDPEVIIFEVADVNQPVAVIPAQFGEKFEVSGYVTSIQSSNNSITIRDAATGKRIKYNIKEDAYIHRPNGRVLKLGQIRRNDEVVLRYSKTS